jgi:hypothetical protein
MAQLHSTCTAPPHLGVRHERGELLAGRGGARGVVGGAEEDDVGVLRRGVAVQVEFESKGLKPGNHISGARVETGRFKLCDNWTGFNLYSPRRGEVGEELVVGGAREVRDVAVLLAGVVEAVGLAQHHGGVHVGGVRRVLHRDVAVRAQE